MQVSDLTFRLKIYFLGFITPIFILLGGLFSAPYWLASQESYSNSELAILEATVPLPTKKMLRSIQVLHQKKAFKKLLLVIRDDKSENLILSTKEREDKIKSALVSQGFPEDGFLVLRISQTKMSEQEDTAKNLLKLLVSENIESLLIISKQFETNRTLKIYRKVFLSLPTKVYIYGIPTEYTATNWFTTEQGVREICSELSKYINSYIRGIL